MLDFHDILATRLGGTRDTAGLLLIMVGGLVTLLPNLPYWVSAGGGLALSLAGGALIGLHFAPRIRIKRFSGAAGLELNSNAVPSADEDGMSIGFVGDTAQELVIPPAEWTRHAMIVGQSGVGKTVLGQWLMLQQIKRGGGLLWIDGKLDPANLEDLHRACAWCGREGDLLVINPGNPALSNTYNPLLDGEPDEIAARCGSLIPEAGASAGADYYRQGAINAIATLVDAIQAAGYGFHFADLQTLLTSGKALEALARALDARASGSGNVRARFGLFIDQYRRVDRVTRKHEIDTDELKRAFGGLGARLAQFGSGGFGHVMSTYAPEVNLFDVVTHNKIVYVMLPTMGKGEAASALGKLVIGDFRTAIARVQALPESERPDPPFLGFFDEAGSYVTQAWSRMFEQARSARLVMVPAFQTRANLATLGDELVAQVAGNTLTKIFFKPGEPETAKWMADMIGQEMQEQRSQSSNETISARNASLADRVRGAGGTLGGSGDGAGESRSTRFGYRVTPDDLVRLGRGEAVALYDGAKVYKLHIPRVTFDSDFVERTGSFKLSHPAAAVGAPGLDIARMLPSASEPEDN